MERFGIRRVVTAGSLCLTAAVAITTVARRLAHLPGCACRLPVTGPQLAYRSQMNYR